MTGLVLGLILVVLGYLYVRSRFIKPAKKLRIALEQIDFESSKVYLTELDDLEVSGSRDMRIITNKVKSLVDVIEERIDMVTDATYTAEHDELTGLYNRAHLEHVKSTYETEGNFGIIFIDVNNLKRMNDEFGHEAGDVLLKSAAKSLTFWKDKGDVYRLGGDEFLVVVRGMSQKKFVSTVKAWYPTVGILNRNTDAFKCVLSYGLAYSAGSSDFDTLEKAADDRMYEMKVKIKKKFGEPMR